MIRARIVQAFAIGNQHAKQRAQLEKLVPIPVVARETRGIQAHHKASLAKADFRDQPLKAMTISARGPGFAKIVVDDMNPLAWPAEQGCSLHQPILQLGALLVMPDLPRRRLSNIHVGELGAVRRRNAIIDRQRPDQHGGPPLTGRTAAADVAPAGPRAAPADVVSRLEAAATGVAALPTTPFCPAEV